MSFRDWLVGTVVSTTQQTPNAKSIVLDVPGWTGSTAGQHVDVRLTAPDGYSAVRAYSLASTGTGQQVELAVDLIDDGEVSPYLVGELRTGDQLEFRGPLGRWFVWKPAQTAPVQLIAGGSGVVPLLAMIRAHTTSGSSAPMRLLYSVRSPADRFFADELAAAHDIDVTLIYTREVPAGWDASPGRVTKDILAAATVPASEHPAVFVCGPTGFVEAVASALVDLGHDPMAVKTERFGGS
ncbi:ferredoxin reductase [Salinibacterium sp.]|uniref:ferredoxin reductase n=1 Tax=Salinibacterium sp. TaxID=1915057 RepID=UPI00286CA5E6|nr:ferredoxin reductase [Salinibacterium sp.]